MGPGIMGTLYCVLQFPHLLNDKEKKLITDTLDYIISLKKQDGCYPNYLKPVIGFKEVLNQWCFGAPGFVLTFMKAYQVLYLTHIFLLVIASSSKNRIFFKFLQFLSQ